MGLWSDFFSLTKFTCRPRAAGVIIAHLVTEKQWFPLFSDAEKAISVYMAKTCKCRCPIIGQIVPNKTQFRGRKYQYHARSASRMYKSTRGDDSDVIRSTILTPSFWRYSMLLRCNVVNLLIHSLSNCCVWNYIRSANKPWHKIFRFFRNLVHSLITLSMPPTWWRQWCHCTSCIHGVQWRHCLHCHNTPPCWRYA